MRSSQEHHFFQSGRLGIFNPTAGLQIDGLLISPSKQPLAKYRAPAEYEN